MARMLTAWVMRFLHNAQNVAERCRESLSAEELSQVKKYWLKVSQKETFGNDIHSLITSGTLHRKSANTGINPFSDSDGLLRVGGRLWNSAHKETKHPVILSAVRPLMSLLVAWKHRQLLHTGVRDTLTQLQEQYWILRARQAVKKVIRRVPRQRQSSRPADEPFAPLPSDHICESEPFEITGVDFAGPIFYTEHGNFYKAYIALFTCATR